MVKDKQLSPSKDGAADILDYRVTQLEKYLTEHVAITQKGLDKIETKLDLYHANFVSKQIFEDAKNRADEIHEEMRKDCKQDHDAIRDRVSSLEGWNQWLIRIALGMVVTAIVGSVLVSRGVI